MVNSPHPRSCWRRSAAFAVAWLVSAHLSFGRAALDWLQQTVEVSATFKQQDARGVFVFRNSGDVPVTITSINPNCGCTTAQLDKKTYAPGEAGQLNVMFEIGDYMGTHDAHVLVTTDIPSTPPADLVLRVRIPEFFRLDPPKAIWPLHGDPEQKTFTCAAVGHEDVWLTEAHATEAAFTVRVETVTPGRKYLVHVRPSTTDTHLVGTIPMQVRIDGVGMRVINGYAYVTGP